MLDPQTILTKIHKLVKGKRNHIHVDTENLMITWSHELSHIKEIWGFVKDLLKAIMDSEPLHMGSTTEDEDGFMYTVVWQYPENLEEYFQISYVGGSDLVIMLTKDSFYV